MNPIHFEQIPNAHHWQPFVHINYLNVIFLQTTCSVHAVDTLGTIRWNIHRPTTVSSDTSSHTFQKLILPPLSVSMYNSTPSPSTIPVPVAVYSLGRLCIQWRQNTDGRATVGLCTVCPLAQLDTAHSHIRLHWTLLHWVLEDMRVCYSLTDCYRPNSADSLCGKLIDKLCHELFV